MLINEKSFLNYLDQQNEEYSVIDEFHNFSPENVEEENEEPLEEGFEENVDELIAYQSKKKKAAPIKTKDKQKMVEDERDMLIGRKIVLFPLIVDIDLIGDTTEIYKPFWSKLYLSASSELLKSDSSLQIFDIGETFTLAGSDSGLIYTWGLDDYYQLGRKTNEVEDYISSVDCVKLNEGNMKSIEKLVAGDNHAFAINHEGSVWVWGDNMQGQLGIGTMEVVKTPRLHPLLPQKKVKEIKSKGNGNICVLDDGKVLFWPFQKSSGQNILKPVELPLPKNIMISSVSCGQNFAMLLSTSGLVFSMGKENSDGQLGQGDTSARLLPTLIEKLKNSKEMVKEISCGFKHVICKTGLGKVFAWGSNAFGQLGLGHFFNEHNPKLIKTDKISTMKFKVSQAKAGFRSSMVLMDDFKVFWCGQTGSLEKTANFVPMDFKSKINVIFQ